MVMKILKELDGNVDDSFALQHPGIQLTQSIL